MTKRRLVTLTAILLAFGIGFLTCFIFVKSAKQEWREIEARRLRQVDKLNRMIEGLNEECEKMTEHNDKVEGRPEEGK